MKDTRENDTARRNVGSDGHKTDGGPLTVGNVMTRQVIMLSPHHSFSDSVSLMAKHSFRHFLVVDASG
jgi:CBS domain-containing protein